ncbi:MAG TPA: PSD1 and planctomycete cytochrome C domain-containing protein [Pirellulales bacterium]|nr:PSD1 and planctomycete cytochrome C domain-containing protein [Pirellulales bacterium]
MARDTSSLGRTRLRTCGPWWACAFLTLAAIARAGEPAATRAIDDDRDVRQILSNNCFKCHGPDAAERQAGLRLDRRDDALKPAESGAVPIVPGKADKSELVRRIFSDDPEVRMPPADSNKRLTEVERDLLKQWIDAGAPWRQLWSFVRPRRPQPPQSNPLRRADWPRTVIDRFVLARLEAEGLEPSGEADRAMLIRRASLDLTGLPPTSAEVEAFLMDTSGDAYERLVDRLMSSPHYGERLALEWLDAARFADTHGYHIDSGRDMSRWREWVIDAFNRNLPFDQFTVEQLAGDLLPEPTLEQRIASGFNRNHMINFEGGAIPEEYHTAYIVDRVNTTGTVWLGLTIGCTQCHDHKFDPLTQKEFYQLFAFFHNVPENGLDGSKGNAAPLVRAPSREQQRRLDELADQIARREQKLVAPNATIDAAQAKWEHEQQKAGPIEWSMLATTELRSAGGATLARLDDGSILASGANGANETYTVVAQSELNRITAVRLETLPDDSFSAQGPGRSVNGNFVLTDVRLAAETPGPVKFKAASADFSQQDYPVANAIDGQPQSGWAIHPEVGKPHAAVFELAEPLTGDGPRQLTIVLDCQSQFGQHQPGRLRLSATDSPDPHGSNALPVPVQELLAIAPAARNAAQQAALRGYYREHVSAELRPSFETLARLRQERSDVDRQVPTTMVMQEMPAARETFLLVRGQYDKLGDKVQPGVPASLPPLPAGAPANRLGLAQWLVGPDQPLTARVIVNRYWQMLFGTGLVKTAEDFGSQGELPSHPELLDWLAVEFRESGWNVKQLLRTMVTSAAYRQSSAVTPELLANDPENRWLGRASRLRLPAELIRDQALAAAGLLDDRIGGQSVSPYQPPGLWEELMSREDGANWTAQTYVQSHGPDLYRRTMYTFWKRTSPPPTLATFDAPDRETCTVRRARTNTPLQALVLLNDPTFVEAARMLAERLLSEAGSTDERIALALRLVLARRPKENELAVLRKVYEQQLAVYRADRDGALALLSVGESPRNESFDAAELAAWASVSSVILNLDEAVTRG